MARVERAGHGLRVESAGTGPPHFLCVHGLVDALEIWERVATGLAARGVCVRYDQRGHGESSAPGGARAPGGACTLGDLAGDALAVLDALAIERAILIGHSLGGIVSLTTALAHPERVAGLVLLGTASQCSERVAGWYERIAQAGERDGTAGLAREIYGERSRRSVHGDARAIAAVTRALKSLYDDPLTPKLAAIRCSALVIVGDRDPMGPRASEIIAKGIPGAELVVLPGLGHWTHVDAPEAILAALDRWLARVAGREES